MLKLYNTLSRKKEQFKPIKGKQVGMYTCGPTIYDFAHIGNFRAYVVSDLLKRYLGYKGFKVKHIMNLTDVDDKTIKGSREAGISLSEYTAKYEKAFFEDLDKLNIERADIFPKATEHIDDMVKVIKILLDKGIAYKSKDGIYYDISKFKGYGKLSHTKIKELKAGARIKADLYAKEQARDFALWKFWDIGDGDVFWETEIGRGRPGWHIECSTMSTKYLGNHFDIHTGGVDLIFPHHENEIAQAEAATGKKFVNYWIHNEWLLVEGKKMSKSLGNFYTLRDLLEKGYDPIAVRYVLLGTHYKQQLNFTFSELEAAKSGLQRLNDFMLRLESAKGKGNKRIPKLIEKVKRNFEKAMDNDLEISEALAAIFEFVRAVNRLEISKSDAKKVRDVMMGFDSVLGILKVKKEKLPKELMDLIKKREQARKKKDYVAADKIREELKARGIILEDTKEGVRWKKV